MTESIVISRLAKMDRRRPLSLRDSRECDHSPCARRSARSTRWASSSVSHPTDRAQVLIALSATARALKTGERHEAILLAQAVAQLPTADAKRSSRLATSWLRLPNYKGRHDRFEEICHDMAYLRVVFLRRDISGTRSRISSPDDGPCVSEPVRAPAGKGLSSHSSTSGGSVQHRGRYVARASLGRSIFAIVGRRRLRCRLLLDRTMSARFVRPFHGAT